MAAYTSNTSAQEAGAGGPLSEASLVHIVSSRLARVEWDPVLLPCCPKDEVLLKGYIVASSWGWSSWLCSGLNVSWCWCITSRCWCPVHCCTWLLFDRVKIIETQALVAILSNHHRTWLQNMLITVMSQWLPLKNTVYVDTVRLTKHLSQ